MPEFNPPTEGKTRLLMSDLNKPQDEIATPRPLLRRPANLPPTVSLQKEQALANSSGSVPAPSPPVSQARPPSPLPLRPPLPPTARPLIRPSETSAARPATSSIVRPPNAMASPPSAKRLAEPPMKAAPKRDVALEAGPRFTPASGIAAPSVANSPSQRLVQSVPVLFCWALLGISALSFLIQLWIYFSQ